jgi:predicted RecA/RadA family phage recombinase
MAKNFIQEGKALHIIADGTEKSGQLIIVENTVGIAINDGEKDELLALHVEGVWALPLPDGLSFAQGAFVYADAAGEVATSGTAIGHAWSEAVAGDPVVHVKLGIQTQ